jgi:hypothetical protein
VSSKGSAVQMRFSFFFDVYLRATLQQLGTYTRVSSKGSAVQRRFTIV